MKTLELSICSDDDESQSQESQELCLDQTPTVHSHIAELKHQIHDIPSELVSPTYLEAVVLGIGSYRGVRLVESLCHVFDRVYCVGPLSVIKKLVKNPKVELIEGNVWEHHFGQKSSPSPPASESPIIRPAVGLLPFLKPASLIEGELVDRWTLLCQRCSHIYITYGCFGVVSQKEYLSTNIKKEIEKKVSCLMTNALEMARTFSKKRIIAYTHLNSQLAVRLGPVIHECYYTTIDELIEMNKEPSVNFEVSFKPSTPNAYSVNSRASTSPASTPLYDVAQPASMRRNLTRQQVESNIYFLLSWIDLIIEAALMYATRQKGYDAVVFRIPIDTVGTADLRTVRKHVSWSLVDIFAEVGMIPADILTPPIISRGIFHPMSDTFRNTVGISISENCHTLYNVVDDSERITLTDCIDSFKRLGYIHVKTCRVDEFEGVLTKTTLSWLSKRITHDFIEFLCEPAGSLTDFSSFVYDQDKRRLLAKSQLKANPRLTALFDQVPSRTTIRKTIDNCLLALLRRGHLRSSIIMDFPEILQCSGVEEVLRKSCVCGRKKGCRCRRTNLMDAVEIGWSHMLANNMALPLRLALTRLCYMSLKTLAYMCNLEDVEERLGNEVGIDLFNASNGRQLYVYGTGADHLFRLLDITAQVDQKFATHAVQSYETFNLYGSDGMYQPRNMGAVSAGLDPRFREMAAVNHVLALGGKKLSAYVSPLALLGRCPLLAFDLGLAEPAAFCIDEVKRNEELLENLTSFQFRFHSHVSQQRKNVLWWMYNYNIHYATVCSMICKNDDGVHPHAAVIHRPMTEVIDGDLKPQLTEFVKTGLQKWIDYEDQMAIEFIRTHPDLQAPRHFAIPILFEDLVKKPHITAHTFLTKLLFPSVEKSLSIVNEIYERYMVSPFIKPAEESVPPALAKQLNLSFAFYHTRYQGKIERCTAESVIWQRINCNSIEITNYYDENGKIRIF